MPSAPLETGGPYITEFMADNEDTREDEDCESGAWIEIYNGQNAATNLAGWSLTNDPAVPKKLMPRLHQALNRARVTEEEVHILRGIARAIARHPGGGKAGRE